MKIVMVFSVLFSLLVNAQPTKEGLEKKLAANPDDRNALYNLGVMSYLEGDFAKASKNLAHLKKLEPTDWKLRAKLIQSYWGEGKEKKVAQEITELRKARASGKHKDLSKKKFFIRDQFKAGDLSVFVLEYYELEGERPLLWKFILRKKGESTGRRLSVGSYPTTTVMMRVNGDIGADDRAYHLDGYWDNGNHTTYGFFKKQPDYASIRKSVAEILAGKKKEVSSTKVK